jgi:hypothetical protein
MAFATSNVKYSSDGDLNRLVGDFTANKGDADGTVAVGGGRVYLAHFYDQAHTTPGGVSPLPISLSTNSTTGITTITVNVSGGVTTGRFYVSYR